jgi:L-seryl-tRNA(Ser) seleniumtransferase
LRSKTLIHQEKSMAKEILRSIPSIEALLTTEVALRLITELGRNRIRELLREISDTLRREIIAGHWSVPVAEEQTIGAATANGHTAEKYLLVEIESRLEQQAALASRPSLRRVVNATGVIIHTNLGRAPLARPAVEAILDVASHYSNLEYDLSRGERGKRESHCQELLSRLAGSEAAIVANNNAAAVLLILNTFAEGGEVIVSRGELVEIGGSFRIPEVMEKSGARLREVGTTNRTRISDYEKAINENTRLLLRVHPSNYRVIGFTERPSVQEIADLAKRAGIPAFEDLGSGCLVDVGKYGVKDEPVVSESLKAGISIVSFSGDKMLGGPQAGIIAGTREMIHQVRQNPLMRALRVDKSTYAALEATLRLYEQGKAESEVPVIRAMALTLNASREQAEQFAMKVAVATEGAFDVTVELGESIIGAGSAPQVTLPTFLLGVRAKFISADSLHDRLRSHRVPIITRTEREKILIDLRTVAEGEETIILDALLAIKQVSLSKGPHRRESA